MTDNRGNGGNVPGRHVRRCCAAHQPPAGITPTRVWQVHGISVGGGGMVVPARQCRAETGSQQTGMEYSGPPQPIRNRQGGQAGGMVGVGRIQGRMEVGKVGVGQDGRTLKGRRLQGGGGGISKYRRREPK